ncbi:glycosyltransferase family 4 protein [Ferrigenium kumadai]|nr:glycosyltransferase family 4 protein [Ferrigenium kumadai]
MKILLLTFYYRPDLSAGSFRATALTKALKEVDPSAEIHVVTTLPNRYQSFSQDALAFERENGITVDRIALPSHKSGMIDQSKAFWSFARQVRQIVRDKQYDLVFVTSSRLMTAALGAYIASKKRAPLYLDIRDIFVDTIKDVLPRHFAILAKPVFALLERWTVNRASRVNLVSQGFAGYFRERYPDQHFSFFTNGIDDEFLSAAPRMLQERQGGAVEVLYAGNLGEGQGLHAIVPDLAKRMHGLVHFKIIGDGGKKDALRTALATAGVDNVELLPPMSRTQLIEAYQVADVLFLHLNDYDAFKKVLPSKLFEYGAMGKPIWAGVSGYAAEFVRAELDNSAVFQPCDAAEAVRVFSQLRLQNEPRDRFVAKFARMNIAREMAADIMELGNERK